MPEINKEPKCCATNDGKHQWYKEDKNWCRMCGYKRDENKQKTETKKEHPLPYPSQEELDAYLQRTKPEINKEWPKKKDIYEPTDEQVGNGAYYDLRERKGFNSALDEAWKVHQSVVASWQKTASEKVMELTKTIIEKDREIERLKEFEWKYKELCK
jgi:quinol monooxygenase YgiN